MTDWERCVAFHGHSCGGLRIGYQAAQYAQALMAQNAEMYEPIRLR